MSTINRSPRVVDNDRDEITVTLDGKEIRGWSYADEAERRVKMLAAREFCEGWFMATERSAVSHSAEPSKPAFLSLDALIAMAGNPGAHR